MDCRHRWFFVFALLGLGCPHDDDEDDAADTSSAEDTSTGVADETTSSDVTTAADTSSTGVDIDALYDCVEPAIQEAKPLSGPGYDPATGLVEPEQAEYIVSATMILVKPEEQEDFFAVVGQVTAQLDASDGMIGYALAVEPTCGFARTISVWRDAEAMIAFAGSDAHAMAMARTTELAVTGKITHWTLAADAFPPTWTTASEQLAQTDPFGT